MFENPRTKCAGDFPRLLPAEVASSCDLEEIAFGSVPACSVEQCSVRPCLLCLAVHEIQSLRVAIFFMDDA